MKKTVLALLGVIIVAAWIAVFANSFAQFERRIAAEDYQWRLHWADRR